MKGEKNNKKPRRVQDKTEADDEPFSLKMFSPSILKGILRDFKTGYSSQTPKQIKAMDAFVVFCLILIGIQLVYYQIVGDFPENSLIIGIFTPLGSAVLTVCMRQQINEKTRYSSASRERSFWEYFIAMYIMFLACVNYLG